jgi:hypothetical protein
MEWLGLASVVAACAGAFLGYPMERFAAWIAFAVGLAFYSAWTGR